MTRDLRRPRLRTDALVRGVALALLLSVGILGWWLWPAGLDIANSISGMVAHLRSWGPWAALASIGLMVAHSFLPFPSEFITVANGMVFGPWWGTLVTWVGAMLGAIVAFALVRLLGRPFVHRMLSAAQLQRLSVWSAKRGGIALLIGRLIPVISFNLLNYGAALTEISWWSFVWATAVGILPMTLLLNFFGSKLLTEPAWNWGWLAVAALALLAWFHSTRRRKRT